MKNDEFVTKWIINTVKEKFADDIALVISHTTLRIDGDPCISYFVPITERGNELSRTFLLDGTGYDIWGIAWERLERFASLEEYNLTVLADGAILYAKDGEWADRFRALQAKLLENLSDRVKSREHALKAYAQAKALYTEMLFAERSDIRMTAGYILDYLARAVAFSNHAYFKGSQTDQLAELKEIERTGRIPTEFPALYLSVIRENDETAQKEKCRQAICMIREYLEENAPDDSPRERNFQDLADWYGELSYTWLRLRHYAKNGDPVKVYMRGVCLQNELNGVCGDFGLEKPELMECFDESDLGAFLARADVLEKKIRAAIVKGGGVIREYNGKEDFLNENA